MQGESRGGARPGRRRMHSELYPMLPAALGMVLGIVGVLPVLMHYAPLSSLVTVTTLALVLFAISDRRTRQRLCLGLAAGTVLVIIHVHAPWQTYRRGLGKHAGGQITAVVTDAFADPGPWEISTRTQRLTVRLRSIRLTGESRQRRCRGKVELVLPADIQVGYGDTIAASGVFLTPPSPSVRGQFNYRNYLISKGIWHQFLANSVQREKGATGGRAPMRLLFRFRKGLAERLVAGFHDEENARSAAAMVLGYRRALEPGTRRIFLRSGALHIFAISGLHVGIALLVAATCLRVLRVPYRARYVVLPFVLGIYVILTGGAPSSVRAWIMLSTLCIATASLRPASSVNSLSLAAVVILAVNPLSLLNTGFQFSFIIVAALVLGWRLVSNILRIESERQIWLPSGSRRSGLSRRWSANVIRSFACGLLAWLGSAGIVARVNCLLIPAAIWLNIMIALLATAALSFAVVKVVVGCLGLSLLNTALARPLEGSLATIRALVEMAARGGGCMAISRPWLPVVLAYYALFAVVLAPSSSGRARRWAGGCMILLVILFRVGSIPRQDRITFIHGNGTGNVALLVEHKHTPPIVAFSGDYLVDLATLDILRVHGYDRLQAGIFAGSTKANNRSLSHVVERIQIERVVVNTTIEQPWQDLISAPNSALPKLTEVTPDGTPRTGSEQLPANLEISALKRAGKKLAVRTPENGRTAVQIDGEPSGSATVSTYWQAQRQFTADLPASREIQVLTVPWRGGSKE